MGGASTWGVNHAGCMWLSQHYWEHYDFGGDKTFLRDEAYPMLKDLTEEWEAELIPTVDGRHLITSKGWSPEHGPNLKEGDRTLYSGVAYDMELVYDLFTNYIATAEILDVDKKYIQHIKELRNKLLPPQIGHWGQLQEWMEDWDRQDDHHRHFMHLLAVHPGKQISPYIDKKYSDAAMVSLDARGDKGRGWSSAWKICMYARLLNGEKAHQRIRELFKYSILTNLFDIYSFGKSGPFQIDANFGYTAGVAEMLLQSHIRQNGEYLYALLPAIPTTWSDGSIKGLRARGGCIVDESWQNGLLQKAVFTALRDVKFRIVYQDKYKSISLKKGQRFIYSPSE